MTRIEDLLIKASPMVPSLPEEFSDLVLNRIKELNLSPVDETQKSVQGGLSLSLGIILLLAGLLLGSFVSTEINANGSLELLGFGNRYLGAFLSYLPLDTIISTIVITSLAAYLIWKSHRWKATLGRIILGVYFSIVAGGAAMASTGLNEQIMSWAVFSEKQPGFFGRIYLDRKKYLLQRNDFQLGKVTEIGRGFVWITDPLGQRKKIALPQGVNVSLDQYVKFAGQTKNGLFQADAFRPCNIRRANMYFSHMKMHSKHMSDRRGMRHMMMRRR